jgi:acetyl-CoA C-acetyltransferase
MPQLQHDEAVIVAIGRSPIARAFKGSLAGVRGDDLAAQVFTQVIDSAPGLDINDVEDLYLGTAAPYGEQGANIARNVAVLLGHDGLPGATVNRFCASSVQTMRMAFHAIKAGEGQAYLVGGAESTSRAGQPEWAGNLRFEAAAARTAALMVEGTPWTDPRDEQLLPDVYIGMGQTAEHVARFTSTTREDQDAFALRSQTLASQSRRDGFWAREITPVTLPDGRQMLHDECIREGTTADGLADLQPVFSPVGSVTAGNACPLNDGASASVVVSARYAADHGLTPLARILSTGTSGLSPEIMGLGPVEAGRRALARAGLQIGDLDIVEINEAFAAQVLPSALQLGIDIETQLNPFGGSIAIGHPFGATGTRLVGTLLNGLRTRDQSLGMAALCVGGGQGMAIVIERLS